MNSRRNQTRRIFSLDSLEDRKAPSSLGIHAAAHAKTLPPHHAQVHKLAAPAPTVKVEMEVHTEVASKTATPKVDSSTDVKKEAPGTDAKTNDSATGTGDKNSSVTESNDKNGSADSSNDKNSSSNDSNGSTSGSNDSSSSATPDTPEKQSSNSGK